MIENYHPGLGDHRWPLVTHFVGCKPCGKFGDYPVERCLKQMDRAFNFGDNQILQIYGFTHKSLASRKVKRVRNETSNPLEMKDELGLLHPAFKAVKVQQTNQVWIWILAIFIVFACVVLNEEKVFCGDNSYFFVFVFVLSLRLQFYKEFRLLRLLSYRTWDFVAS